MAKQFIVDVQQKMDSLCASVYVRLCHLSNVCKSSISSLQAREIISTGDSRQRGRSKTEHCCFWGLGRNAILPSGAMQEVVAILGYVHGQSVEVVDMFRLGRLYPAKKIPW